MSTARRTTWFMAGAILIAAVLLSLRSCGGSDVRSGRGDSGAGADSIRGSFAVTGNVRQPMTPGIMVPIDLLVDNPYDFEMVVSHLAVAITSVHAPDSDASHPCTVDDFSIEQLPPAATLTIAAGDSSTVTPGVGSRDGRPGIGLLDRATNQDGCKHATVALHYTAQGRAR